MRRRGIGRPAQPSLVNTAARTAVVVGTASAVSNKAASNQAAKAQQSATAAAAGAAAAAQPPPPDAAVAPAPAAASQPALSDDVYDQLKKLGELREAGILTDDEFQAKKTQILGL